MDLHVINTGYFKLDGGAMFGVVPKSIWQRTNPADDKNLCTWAMRCLLVEDGDRLILIDNGIGDKLSQDFLKFYYLHGDDSLEKSFKQAGFSFDDVTDVFLTHLHFDHCGGGVKFDSNQNPILTFKNAKYWSNEDHWKWATHKPNPREKASFLNENILPVQESGHLEFLPVDGPTSLYDIEIIWMDGHTEKQMLPMIKYKNRTLVFMADLIPSVGHIPVPYLMGYDVRPLLTMEEKKTFLDEAVENEYILMFEHDPINECCTVKHTEKGIKLDHTFKLSEI